LARLAEERHYSKGATLFLDGDPCEGLHLIAEGTVKIVKTSNSGREIMLAMESGPSSVAEIPLFDGGPYPATVIAVTPVVVFVVPTGAFRDFCTARGDVACKLMAVVGRRLRRLVWIVESLTFGSVRQRLASTLLEDYTPAAKVALTHDELALRLGTVREVVSRNLSRFQAKGLVRAARGQITILDTAGLRAEADTEF